MLQASDKAQCIGAPVSWRDRTYSDDACCACVNHACTQRSSGEAGRIMQLSCFFLLGTESPPSRMHVSIRDFSSEPVHRGDGENQEDLNRQGVRNHNQSKA